MRLFFVFVLFFKIALVVAITYLGVGLGPDEAQYWTWSKELAPGYYSKPPGIAWQIALGTLFFGDNEIGVRFGALLLGTLLPLSVYLLGKHSGLSDRQSCLAGVAFALTPLGILSTLFAITDVGNALFWTLAIALIAKALTRQENISYIGIGLCVFAGALFKWQIYWLWPLVMLAWIQIPSLRSYRIAYGIGISLLGLLPSLYWNIAHDWATFKHVGATLAGGHAQENVRHFLQGNFLEFLGMQALLFSPLFFLILIGALFRAFLRRIIPFPDSFKFVFLSVGVPLFFHLIWSIGMKIQGNWCDYIYPTAMVLVVWITKEVWVHLSIAVSCLVWIIGLILGLTVLPHAKSPFKHNVGWNMLPPLLQAVGYNPQTDFLFSDKYQTTSILSFYSPLQKRAYFFNLHHARLNQFSFWPSMNEEQKGRWGYFVVVENSPHLQNINPENYQRDLQPYFSSLSYLGAFPLVAQKGNTMKTAYIFKGKYLGGEPEKSIKY